MTTCTTCGVECGKQFLKVNNGPKNFCVECFPAELNEFTARTRSVDEAVYTPWVIDVHCDEGVS